MGIRYCTDCGEYIPPPQEISIQTGVDKDGHEIYSDYCAGCGDSHVDAIEEALSALRAHAARYDPDLKIVRIPWMCTPRKSEVKWKRSKSRMFAGTRP